MNSDFKKSGLEQGLRALLYISDICSYLCLALMMLVIVIEVFSRAVFGTSLNVSEEIASYSLVTLLFFGVSGCFSDNSLLRVDAFYQYFSINTKKRIDLIFKLLSLLITGIYSYYILILSISSFKKNIKSDTLISTPLYIPQYIILIGIIFLFITIAIKIIIKENYELNISKDKNVGENEYDL